MSRKLLLTWNLGKSYVPVPAEASVFAGLTPWQPRANRAIIGPASPRVLLHRGTGHVAVS